MSLPEVISRYRLAVAQLGVACLTLFAIACAPPARGTILIVSLAGERAGEIARWAVNGDIRLIGRGPWPHSLVVTGSRTALVDQALQHRGLLVAVPRAGCRQAV